MTNTLGKTPLFWQYIHTYEDVDLCLHHTHTHTHVRRQLTSYIPRLKSKIQHTLLSVRASKFCSTVELFLLFCCCFCRRTEMLPAHVGIAIGIAIAIGIGIGLIFFFILFRLDTYVLTNLFKKKKIWKANGFYPEPGNPPN